MGVLSQTEVMVVSGKQEVWAPRPVQILETRDMVNGCGKSDGREQMNIPAAGRREGWHTSGGVGDHISNFRMGRDYGNDGSGGGSSGGSKRRRAVEEDTIAAGEPTPSHSE